MDCDYCDGDYLMPVSESVSFGIETHACIDGGKLLVNAGSLENDYDHGYSETPINYCPMCGRKLKEG